AALARPKVPKWAVPVLAALPIWAIVYAGTLTVPDAADADPILSEGRDLYEGKCAGCHGGEGGGGLGRPLSAGEVLLTFPDPADHLAWVTNGSPEAGTPYGDPDREGGQQVSQDGFSAMPAFGPDSPSPLTEEEIVAVVRYEREILSGEIESALASDEIDEGGTSEAPENEAQSEGGDTGGGESSEAGDTGG
ncbi:MAG: c-type cytochrome, partial [Actinomycetota bacterium]|nr:c-type cytochrome [Actinomycetota bacterium]